MRLWKGHGRGEGKRRRVHIGAGTQSLPGWFNLDLRPLPGVDVVADVTEGLPFSAVEAVYAEHFLEHLSPNDALDYLLEAHRILRPDGRLRLSTPNLDWVWASHYQLDAEPKRKGELAIMFNCAFYGWEHRFLWNRELLESALGATGFEKIEWCRYGESRHPVFVGIERHETYQDLEELPHVLIVEATPGSPRPKELIDLTLRFEKDFLAHVKQGY